MTCPSANCPSETITGYILMDRDGTCPSLVNSAGVPGLCCSERLQRCAGRHLFQCVYDRSVFDSPETVKSFQDAFPFSGLTCNGTNYATLNQQEYNSQLLPFYCNQTVMDCPTYSTTITTNVPARGCSRFVTSDPNDAYCAVWAGNTALQPEWSPTMTQYCDKIDTPDCACINRDKNVVYNAITSHTAIPLAAQCWYTPCQESNLFLNPPPISPAICPSELCLQINTIIAGIQSQFQDINFNDLNACGASPPLPWYEQWWIWALAFLIIFIVAALLLFYTLF